MLNWTVEAIVILLSGIPMYYGVVLLFRKYLEHHDRIFGLLTLSWFLQSTYLEMYGIAYLLLSPVLIQLNALFLVLNVYSLIILYDYMRNNGIIDPIKIIIATILSVYLLYAASLPNSVTPSLWDNGDPSLFVNGQFRIATALMAMYMGLIYLYYAVLILRNVPEHLKFGAKLNLLGVVIFSYIVVILFALRLTSIIPGSANFISALGGLISIYAFVQSPQLIYVLPFTVSKLLVMDSHAGTTLYVYNWVDTDVKLSDDLIVSALSGLSSFTSEAVKAGKIQQIVLETGILYVEAIQSYQIILIADAASSVLQQNIQQFSRLFVREFGNRTVSGDTTRFKNADHLIIQAFPYIPRYQNNSE